MESPPYNSENVIEQIEAADITKDDWYYPILVCLPNYWLGYFERYVEELGNSLSSHDETFRDELVSHMESCWRK